MPLIHRKKSVEPSEDYGFFGPGSVTWKVWSYPTSLTIGFQRAVVVEELDPALIAWSTRRTRSSTGPAPATTARCGTSRWWRSATAVRPRRRLTYW
jgi:hypothetical protein